MDSQRPPLRTLPGRDQFPLLQAQPELIYLDSAATSQKPLAVLDAERDFYTRDYANVHRGSYQLAARATAAYEGARARVARFLNAEADEIVFTRGCTEAINLVAASWGCSLKAGDEILVSTLEHHANIVPWQLLAARCGAIVRPIPLNQDGQIDLAAFHRLLGPRTRLLAITQAANATGTRPPLAEILAAARAHGVTTLVDGAQGVVHDTHDMQALGADFYAFSGHKLFGPTGIGVLYGRGALLQDMPPWQGGGEMIESVSFDGTRFAEAPQRFEAGTPPIAQAVGLAAALDWLSQYDLAHWELHELALQHQLEAGLSLMQGVHVLARHTERAPISSLHFSGAHPYDVAQFLDARSIAARVGQHCAQPLLAHLGVSSTLRLSFGPHNTTSDVEQVLAALAETLDLLA
ncbi:aminotransferase class V-fold PLP-dependent enzyme [Chitinilyticum piscinae]|uniref:Probable cysteine desulfurase n=1 Tax=Chitinilyticum piscinae TaxID=2866724 RepID=A0A8J7FKJ1_9NEIS|nr:cysteine desulfurase [Chitinilyticum piscinae]MBE9609692.1 cysteine desulfurase [Chitinilyticum piscinae]